MALATFCSGPSGYEADITKLLASGARVNDRVVVHSSQEVGRRSRGVEFAHDSALEGDGFELPVLRDKASVPRFRFGPPSVISTDGSRR